MIKFTVFTLLLVLIVSTTLIKNSEAFNYSIDEIIKISKKIEFDKISAIESRGFIFASAVSYLTKKPLILLRKKTYPL